ncbi:MAG: hypothetical protein ISS71_07280 [Phycisphaerae bacterium]|nr:hypothetical protein [Phycisphaerae bacterium]
MNNYDFDYFLERMSHEDYIDILRKAENEGANLEKHSFGSKGCVDRRKAGSVELSRKIGEFLFFMRNGIKPASVNEEDFKKYKIVVQALVDKGQMKPEALKIFDET